MLKRLGKDKTLISWGVTFRFYSGEDYQEFNMAKSKVIVSKIAENWGGFPLKIRYLANYLSLHVVTIMSNIYICSKLKAWQVILD